MVLYKGYIKTNGKVPIDKIKGVRKFRSFEEVVDDDSYAGVLAEDVILIDVDTEEQADIMMDIVEDLQLNCRVLKTTRGRHFLFKNNGIKKCATHVKLACGLEADIKIGLTNTIQCLKINGVERFVEWDIEEGGEYQNLPKFMYPVKSDFDFLGMKDGDGRDSALFAYILSLNRAGFSKDESKECINIINKYLLNDPMSDEDIERITRDEAFPEQVFFEDNKFLHNNFAEFIKNNNHVKRINGQLHVYSNGVYVEGTRHIEGSMIKAIPTLRAAQRAEVLKYLDIICPDNEKEAEANLIAFKNGIYDISTGTLRAFSPDIVITNKIPWDYNPDAYSELLDKTLNKIACEDDEIRDILEESIGYSFYRRNELSKSFMLTGSGANGKSTFLDLVKDVLGQNNISALNLEELGERFSIATMGGKLANIGDDISDEFLKGKELANFKKIVSGNLIKSEIKNDPNIAFLKPNVKLFFSCNDMPSTKSKGLGALMRRLVQIPFDAKFTSEDPDFDPFITYKLKSQEVMEYAILLGLDGLERVLANKDFTKSAKVKIKEKEYELENNPILEFLSEKDVERFINQPVRDIYRSYKVFCLERECQPLKMPNFSKEVCKRCGISTKRVRINGEQISVYVKGM